MNSYNISWTVLFISICLACNLAHSFPMSNEGDHEGCFFENDEVWAFENSDNSGKIAEELDKKMDSSLPSCREEAREKKVSIELTGRKRNGECSRSAKRTKCDNDKDDEAGKGESDPDSHIWTERERRKKMRNMFVTLHSLLPHLPHKADKSTIVDEAINYISKLQNNLQKLQKQKSERLDPNGNTREAFLADRGSSSNNLAMSAANSFPVPRFPINFHSFTSQNVALSVCGDVAHISICSRKKPGLVAAICYLLVKHRLEVVSAHVSSNQISSLFMIQVHANGNQNQFPAGFPVEEIFKQVATEIMLHVTS